MDISRKRFCASMAGATVTLWLQACGGGGGGDGGSSNPPPGSTVCGAAAGNITGNHGHTLTIPKADLDSTTAKTYNLAAATTDGHIHSVTFSPTDLATLKSGGAVPVTSTTNVSHSHLVTTRVASTCA
jgi:hypothetical protein